jgi:hypothetical protein
MAECSSTLPSDGGKPPSSAAPSTTGPPLLELESPPPELPSASDASRPAVEGAEEPQCAEKRLAAITQRPIMTLRFG